MSSNFGGNDSAITNTIKPTSSMSVSLEVLIIIFICLVVLFFVVLSKNRTDLSLFEIITNWKTGPYRVSSLRHPFGKTRTNRYRNRQRNIERRPSIRLELITNNETDSESDIARMSSN
jgi:hypothetical protein